MKFIRQFLIIISISLIGEVMGHFIPLPIPGSIYGLILMFFALQFKVFPLDAVKETSKFLIDIMPIMFVPPGVCVLEYLDVLKAHWWQIVLISIVSTFVVMIVTGLVTQLVMEGRKRKKNSTIHIDTIRIKCYIICIGNAWFIRRSSLKTLSV